MYEFTISCHCHLFLTNEVVFEITVIIVQTNVAIEDNGVIIIFTHSKHGTVVRELIRLSDSPAIVKGHKVTLNVNVYL